MDLQKKRIEKMKNLRPGKKTIKELTGHFGRNELSQMGTRAARRILSVLAAAVAAGHEKAPRADPGQLLALGQTEMPARSQVEAALFVALQLGPVVDAKELPRRHAAIDKKALA